METHPSLADIMGAGRTSLPKRDPEGRTLPAQDSSVEKEEQARGPKSKSCPWVLGKYSLLGEMPVGSWPVIAFKIPVFYQLKVNLFLLLSKIFSQSGMSGPTFLSTLCSGSTTQVQARHHLSYKRSPALYRVARCLLLARLTYSYVSLQAMGF